MVFRAIAGSPRLRALALATVLASPALLPLAPSFTGPLDAATLPKAALPGSFGDLVERVSPAVVSVIATRPRVVESPAQGAPRGEPGPRGEALGSGFIVDPSGYIVTNNHVIAEATSVAIVLEDGRELEAQVIGSDDKVDLALLKVEAEAPLPHLTFGDSDAVRVGDWTIAVGNPFGLGGTVTAGIVSARGRDINSGPYDDYLQLDTAINSGNSGGPTFDVEGNVIGINTAIYSPSGGNVGIGFAIPSNLAAPLIDQLKEQGFISRGWLGVQIQNVTPLIAESLALGSATGALVAQVTPASPAASAGLQVGDVILALEGEPIGTVRDLTRRVALAKPGEPQALTVWRKGDESTLTVSLGQAPKT